MQVELKEERVKMYDPKNATWRESVIFSHYCKAICPRPGGCNHRNKRSITWEELQKLCPKVGSDDRLKRFRK